MAARRLAAGGGGGDLDRDAVDLAEHVAVAERGERLAHRAFVGGEADIDRVDRDQRGQHGRGGPGRDEVADRHVDAPDTAVDRRPHFGVAEVELGGLHVGLRRAQIGLRFLVVVGALVEVLHRDDAGIDQFLAAVELVLGEQQPRLGGGGLRLGAVELGLEGLGIDGDQQVALLHQRALAEVDGLHRAGNARAHLDALHRLQAAGELVPLHGVARLQHRHRDRHGRRGGRGGRRIGRQRVGARPGEEYRRAGGERRQRQDDAGLAPAAALMLRRNVASDFNVCDLARTNVVAKGLVTHGGLLALRPE